MKDKRGLSKIIITLILIGVVLVAVALLWGPLRRIIQEKTEITEIQRQFLSEYVEFLSLNRQEPFLNVTIKKIGGEIKTSEFNTTSLENQKGLEVDIFSVVDLSGSMVECDDLTSTECASLGGSGSDPCYALPTTAESGCIGLGGIWNDKLTPTQNANKDMINNILNKGDNRIGLVAYRNLVVATNSTNLTKDSGLLNIVINSWKASSTTCICCGINDASWKFRQQSADERFKSLIVMSDGEANVRCAQQNTGDAKRDAIKAACDANASLRNLEIYAIGVQGADEETLTDIAECGGGKYFSVTNTSELIKTYEVITQDIQRRYEAVNSLSYYYFMFYNSSDSYREKITDIPTALQTKTYGFNLEGKLSGDIIKVEIYPVVISSLKKEIIGQTISVWNKS